MNYYENHKFVSVSLLKQYDKSPAKAKAYIVEKQKDTDAMRLGRVFHDLMDDNTDNFIVFDAEKRPEPEKAFGSKLNKEWKAEIFNSKKDVIEKSDHENTLHMVAAIKASNFYKRLIGTEFEASEKEYYHTFQNGNKAKCKPDKLYNGVDGGLICVDWKTTSESLAGKVRQTEYIIRKFGYGLQDVHYAEILKQITNKKVYFFFMFVENKPPYDVLPVYINPDGEFYDLAFQKWNELLTECNNSFNTDTWKTLEQSLTNEYLTI